MKAIERIDEEMPDGTIFTKKKMDNGEVRTRVKYKNGFSISGTESSYWSPGDNGYPWQDSHFHVGLIEVYTQIEGWSVYIFQDPISNVIESRILKNSGDTIVFRPGVPHSVLLGPGAIISTQLFGEPVGNPDRKNNDWWPVSDEYTESAKTLFPLVETSVTKRFF